MILKKTLHQEEQPAVLTNKHDIPGNLLFINGARLYHIISYKQIASCVKKFGKRLYRNRHTACADSYALIIRKISWCSSTCIMGVKADRIRKRKKKKHQRTKSWMCWKKFKCIKLLLSYWFSNEQSKTGSILFLYQMWLLWYPILTPPKTTVHIEDRATCQFEV